MAERFSTVVAAGAVPNLPLSKDHSRSLKFPSFRRIKTRREFMGIRKGGKYLTFNGITFQWMKTALPHTRVGITATTKQGSAVERATYRRRVREAFRHSPLFSLSGIDINVKVKGHLPISFQTIAEAFQHLYEVVF